MGSGRDRWPSLLIRLGRLRFDDEGLTGFEDRTLARDRAGHPVVAREAQTPIQIRNWWKGWTWSTLIEAHASDSVMPDVMKVGGVTGWVRGAALAYAKGSPAWRIVSLGDASTSRALGSYEMRIIPRVSWSGINCAGKTQASQSYFSSFRARADASLGHSRIKSQEMNTTRGAGFAPPRLSGRIGCNSHGERSPPTPCLPCSLRGGSRWRWTSRKRRARGLSITMG
jgi:hypothetical protein